MKVLPDYLEENKAECSVSISLIDNLNVLTHEDAKKIADYMDSCLPIYQFVSNIQDVISKKMSIPFTTWSDGFYFWDSSHTHYVREYRVRLPEDFITHVKNQIKYNCLNIKNLNELQLRDEYDNILENISNGDESYYDGSYRLHRAGD